MQIEGTFYKVIIHPKYSDNIYYVDCLGQGCTVNYVSYCPDIGESDSWNHNWFSSVISALG